jgi:N-methylhydantoinase A/oxoprolinase/acetone carboxylase beta subunit
MQSDGGLTDVGSFSGHRAILSGPAGGYVGYALTTPAEQTIGFDMGGTSTDVSRFAGAYSHVFESTTAGVTIQVRLSGSYCRRSSSSNSRSDGIRVLLAVNDVS